MAMKWNQDTVYWAPQKKLGGGWIAFKDGGSAPSTPDPMQTAAAQTKSNIDTAVANAILNRVNQYTPYGSLTYNQVKSPGGTQFDQVAYDNALAAYNQQMKNGGSPQYDPSLVGYNNAGNTLQAPNRADFMTGNPNGVSQWESHITLAPDQQALLDSNNRIAKQLATLAEGQLGNVANSINKPLDFSSLTPIKSNPLSTTVTRNGDAQALKLAAALLGK